MGKPGAKTSWILLLLVVGLPVHAATLVDMVGRRVALHGPPHRIISLAPSLTEILYALGAGDAVVGVTDYATYPPEVEAKPSVGGGINPNLEVIVALRPDLVLVSADANRWDTITQLEQLQIPVFGVKPVGVEGVFVSIAKVGEVVGRRQEAGRLIADMRRRMATVSEKVQDLPRPEVLYVVWIDPLIVAGRGTVIDGLIAVAGGVNVVRTPGFSRYSLERVVVQAPNVILLALDGGVPEDREVLRRLPGWREMRAVREGAVRVIDANLINRPGPRIVEAVELLGHLLHPGAFGGRSS
ncbi:MAG: cobalamin-binding protein [candidate division NC10 bacterium]|nr:cobalamin-binding protein [candidate division NC10 bacterium]